MKSDETPSLLPEGAVAVRFHSIGGWGAITTGKNLGAILGDLNDLLYERDKIVDELGNPKEIIHVSANPKYGSEKKGAPTAYFMVAAPERIRVNCDLRHVTVVLCCDPKAFTHTNPLDGMAEGGCLVWESDEEGEQAWERLPLWARKQIIDKKIRVFTLPGFQIARKATDRADLQLRMQGNAFLGAFFAVSPLLGEFRITHGAVPRSRSQAVCEEVRPVRRRGREVEHGSHDPGLRTACARSAWARLNAPDRSTSARRGAAAVVQRVTTATGCHRMPLLPVLPLAKHERTPVTRIATFDCRVPRRPRLQPAVVCAMRRSASWPPAPATPRRSTSRAARRRSTSPKTARSAWSASPCAPTRRCPTVRRTGRRSCTPR